METDISLIKNNNRKYIIIIIAVVVVLIITILLINIFRKNNTIITINDENICNNNIYDGFPKKLIKLETNEQYTIFDNEATESGEYTIIIKPNKGYAWENNIKDDKKITCTINKAKSTLTINKDKINITQNNNVELTLDTNTEGKISLNLDNSNVSIKEGMEINKANKEISITIKGIKEGKTNLQITFNPTNKNFESITKDIEINVNKNNSKKKVAIPNNNVCNKVTYNGNTQKLVNKTDFDGYTLKGQLEGKEAGNYKIEAVLKNGYIWEDGKTNSKELVCSIEKKQLYSINTKNLSCTVGEKKYITIENIYYNPNTKESVKSIKNNSTITKVISKNTCDCTKISCEKCMYPGRYEITCLKSGTDDISFQMDNGEILSTKVTVK